MENIEGWANFKTVYESLKDSKKLKLRILICPINDARQAGSLENKYIKIANFLKENNINFTSGIKENHYIDLKTLYPELVLFPHPYDCLRVDHYNASIVSQYTKIGYITYGFMLSKSDDLHYKNPFFQFCTRIFVESEYYIQNFARYYSMEWAKKTCIASGQPKIDCYLGEQNEPDNYWPRPKSDKVKRIIIAPHWTIEWNNDDGTTSPGYCQFLSFKDIYLELPQKYPNVDFVLRPHPLLYNTLIEKELMTQEELNNYKKDFLSYNNTAIDSDALDYFDAFTSSDALITDGVSFLAEYLPSKKPILHLISDQYAGFNEFGENLVKNYYKAKKPEELIKFLDEVVIQSNDYLYTQRMNDMGKYLFLPSNGSGKFIAENIEKLLLGTK
ncbi:CDP-glycerol glycerophosphotransferase family protein [Holosporaceae bacterium 'Namur']|nr:CDP-glycerol glycerophosphotransferase family protein [Holosporaceae bacterium 'Namur']